MNSHRPVRSASLAALFAVLLITGCQQSPPPPAVADPESSNRQARLSGDITDSQTTLMINALIYTQDSAQPTANAMAFNADGIILAVGEQASLSDQYPDARQFDLKNQGVVVPGLIDAHGHLMNLGFSQITANLAGTTSKADILQRLQAKADELPAGSWLIGRGWDQNDWQDNAGLFPNAADLDAAFPRRPVWLTRIDGHAGWANTAAMQMVTAEKLRTNPDGGRILRDDDGQPNGVFIDRAMQLVTSLIPPPDSQTEQLALQQALQVTAAYGLTGVHEAGTALRHLQLYQDMIAAHQFPLRLYAMADGQGAALEHLCQHGVLDHPSGLLDARAVKFYLDGALGSRGAALVDDYSDEPGNRGLLFVQPDAFAGQVAAAMRCGLQVNTHAIGDRANQVLIDAYAEAMRMVPGHSGRHRIEHAQVMREEDFKRSAELQLIASVQPTHATSDMYWAEDRVGPQRIRHAYAWQDFIAADTRLALGSDFPVESANPLLGFYAAISRQDTIGWPDQGWYPRQRLSRAQALHGFTLGAAYAAYWETETGSLEPGKKADFVWLSNDIMEIPAGDIPDTKVWQTWLNGRKIYPQDND